MSAVSAIGRRATEALSEGSHPRKGQDDKNGQLPSPQPGDDAPAPSYTISRISHVSLRSRPARIWTRLGERVIYLRGHLPRRQLPRVPGSSRTHLGPLRDDVVQQPPDVVLENQALAPRQ